MGVGDGGGPSEMMLSQMAQQGNQHPSMPLQSPVGGQQMSGMGGGDVQDGNAITPQDQLTKFVEQL